MQKLLSICETVKVLQNSDTGFPMTDFDSEREEVLMVENLLLHIQTAHKRAFTNNLLRFEDFMTLNTKIVKYIFTGDIDRGCPKWLQKREKHLTASLSIQNALAMALEQGNFALMASLDLSSAFEVVKIKLLLKRM